MKNIAISIAETKLVMLKLSMLREGKIEETISHLEINLDSKIIDISMSEDAGNELSPYDQLNATYEQLAKHRAMFPSQHTDPEILDTITKTINRQ